MLFPFFRDLKLGQATRSGICKWKVTSLCMCVQVLKNMDDANAIWDLAELGERGVVAHHEDMKRFVKCNLFPSES